MVMLPLAALAFVLVQRTQADRDPQPAGAARLSVFATLHDRALGAGLGMSTLVAAVMMTTLVAGPFYLSHTLGLDAGQLGLAMALGPAGAALAGLGGICHQASRVARSPRCVLHGDIAAGHLLCRVNHFLHRKPVAIAQVVGL